MRVCQAKRNRYRTLQEIGHLFIAAARRPGLASRLVSGYPHAEPSAFNYGSTHARAEVYLPGTGWTGFNPTSGGMAGSAYFVMAMARQSELAFPFPATDSIIGPFGR